MVASGLLIGAQHCPCSAATSAVSVAAPVIRMRASAANSIWIVPLVPEGAYDLLFKISAETMLTVAADPKHLGARIGITSVLRTWGSALTHHPHVHMIVPGGGISPAGQRWVSCRARILPLRARALPPVPAAVPGEARRHAPSQPP